MTDPFVGKLTYLRVYSGSLDSGLMCSTPVSDKKERIGRLFRCTPTTVLTSIPVLQAISLLLSA